MKRPEFHGLFILWLVHSLTVTGLAAPGTPALVDAAKKKDMPTVRRLLAGKVDVNAPAPDGATALHWAAYRDDVEIAALLVRAGANVNAVNEYGATPLWVACSTRNTASVLSLVKAGANVNLALASGETSLMRCTFTGDPVAVGALLTHGANVHAKEPVRGQTALMWAAANRQPGVTRLLIEHGSQIDARTPTERQFRGTSKVRTGDSEGADHFAAGGFTPLLFAARAGDIDSTRFLLAAGADVNDATADGNTALAVAAFSGHGPVAALLLEKGADANAAKPGYSTLHLAVLRGDAELVRTLLARGANPNLPLTKGTPVPRHAYQYILTPDLLDATPFMLAAKFGEPAITRLLAAAGADMRVPLKNGTTPLMAAAGWGWSRIHDRRGRLLSPELLTAERENERRVLDGVKAVIELGADVNAASTSGDTALHAAAVNEFKTVVDYLVAQGGNLDAPNKAGKTPRAMLQSSSTVTSARQP